MAPDKLAPKDDRVKYESAQVRGKTYSYILAEPQGEPIATVFLIHGYPDLSFGWRYQVPYLRERGLRVVVPDMLGYGGTDAPESVEEYTPSNTAADIRELVRQFVGEGQIILGGHDWGGATVWRFIQLYPELIQGVFCLCTPYIPPSSTYVPLETLIENGKMLNFKYQLQFKGPDVEREIQGTEKLRQFFAALYGGSGPNGERGFNTDEGVVFDNLPKLSPPRLLSEAEWEHYVAEYGRHKPEMRGPLNWYRMREFDAPNSAALAEKGMSVIDLPTLFIGATQDAALPPSMSAHMDMMFSKLRRGEVNATHWAMVQAPEEVNGLISKWIEEEVLQGKFKAAL